MSPPPTLHGRGLELLRQALNAPAAEFRDGQWQAIEALVARRARLLLVQRTGWGKSAVYFLGAKLLREQGGGPTLIVSPLLALMRNQLDAAARLGVRAFTINSSNRAEWDTTEQALREDRADVLIISPERLANDDFTARVLIPHAGRVALFVVDEAHCISDWGHDFRPDYRRIVRILERLPPNVPVCATTATANDRVVADVAAQLGRGLEVSRGPLIRESLRLQTVPLPDSAAKLAWLAHYLPKLPGSGIVYALTIRWAERIAAWLHGQGVTATAYHADLPDEDRRDREDRLLRNEIKALVATTALGMGYDKPDLGFVVHFHQPASVVHYYQQVGRAGRAVDRAYGVMLAGGDDREINDYFIDRAFPAEQHVSAILAALEAAEAGLTRRELEAAVNLSGSRIEQALKVLAVETPAPIAYLNGRWVTTPQKYDPQRRRRLVEHLTGLRRREQEQMDAYLAHRGCFMEFLARALDDPTARPCDQCAVCKGKADALREVPDDLTAAALTFLNRSEVPIEPRKQWPAGAMPVCGWKGRLPDDLRAMPGRALCILGDPGWGKRTQDGKYHDGRFGDDLIEALAGLVRGWKPTPAPTWVTCVPSLAHPDLVPDLASRLAARLSLRFVPAVRKVRHTRPQKEMENSWQQANNLDGAFGIDSRPERHGPVLLVDDIYDSGWTFTVTSALLRQAGCPAVFPVALAANR